MSASCEEKKVVDNKILQGEMTDRSPKFKKHNRIRTHIPSTNSPILGSIMSYKSKTGTYEIRVDLAPEGFKRDIVYRLEDEIELQ